MAWLLLIDAVKYKKSNGGDRAEQKYMFSDALFDREPFGIFSAYLIH